MAIQQPIRLAMLTGLALLAAASVYYNVRWLGAESYLRFSEQRGQSAATRTVARHAADIAHRLQPSSARALKTLASNDLFLRQDALALDEYSAALRLAPADAYLWRDYALALIYTETFDPRLEHAVIQAQTWGRRAKPIHLSLAIAGLRVFRQSSPALRSRWLESIRLAYQDQPNALLWVAYVADEELLLCDNDIIQKAEANGWCAAARWRHGLCSTVSTDATGCFRKQVPQP